MLRVLFVGESWLGSCARSLKEAITRQKEVLVDEVNEDLYLPKPRALWARFASRVLSRTYRRELEYQIKQRCREFAPDVLVVYKGWPLDADFVRQVGASDILSVNVFPDYSPLTHGQRLRVAMGAYRLVLSTKPYHPDIWASIYGYRNECVFIAQGYDPGLHLVTKPVTDPRFDVVLAATWRPEYHELLSAFGRLMPDSSIRVGIAGHGWAQHRGAFPTHWEFVGPLQGQSYVCWLRSGRIALAPVTRSVVIDGQVHPGDEDSTRTYELAAAHCFFIHRRTELVRALYDEATEVPFFDSAEELAERVTYFLPLESLRCSMAAAAHRRAVTSYSIDARAAEVLAHIRARLK